MSNDCSRPAYFPCRAVSKIAVGFMDQPLEGFRCVAFGKDPNSSVLFVQDSHLWWKWWSAKQIDFLDNPATTGIYAGLHLNFARLRWFWQLQ